MTRWKKAVLGPLITVVLALGLLPAAGTPVLAEDDPQDTLLTAGIPAAADEGPEEYLSDAGAPAPADDGPEEPVSDTGASVLVKDGTEDPSGPFGLTLTYTGSSESRIASVTVNGSAPDGGTTLISANAAVTVIVEPTDDGFFTGASGSFVPAADPGSDGDEIPDLVWDSDARGAGTVTFTMPAGPVELALTLDPAVTVTFDAMGGSAVPSQKLVKGGTAAEPEDPTKEDLEFQYWYVSDDADEFLFRDPVTEDTTVHALWAGHLYITAYDMAGGKADTGGTVSAVSGFHPLPENSSIEIDVLEGDLVDVSAAAADGYRFSGWTLNSPDGTVVSADPAYAFEFTANTSLYACMLKELNMVEVTVKPPVCGTSTSCGEDLNTQTSPPQVSVPKGAPYAPYTGSSGSSLPAVWAVRAQDSFGLYRGTFEGGSEYGAAIILAPASGYVFADSGSMAAVVNGKAAGYIASYTDRLDLFGPVTAVHDWNAGTVRKKASFTEAGTKLFTCRKCGATETRTVPKLTVSGIVNKTYTGAAQTQSPTVKSGTTALKAGTDYTLSYKNNVNAGTATVTITGRGNYTGSTSRTFTIAKASIAKASVASLAERTWTGKAQTPTPTVKLKLGGKTVTLKKDTDYTVSYKNNTAIGRASVTIRGKGNYTGSVSTAFWILPAAPHVYYRVHRQTYGWETGWKKDGEPSGTTGQSKRLEGIYIKTTGGGLSGSIQYRTHIQTFGWEKKWKNAGEMSGTTGKSKRLEAIQIRLTGDMAQLYDVYYRVHAQHFGWMGWAKNGASAGTAGYAYRLEAIQIVLMYKGGPAPGSTANSFRQKK